MTKFKEWGDYAIDVLVGGTPCQSFSVAGLRKGLADPRGNLMLTYLAIADKYRPQWLVWENVPGVLSSNGGKDFGTFLGGLGELGYGVAYRVLDAQYFGVPQRRRRVFVVGCLGDWRCAASVLFERHSLQGHSAPCRQAGKNVAPTLSARTKGGGGLGTDFDCDAGLITGTMCMATGQAGAEIGAEISPTLSCNHEAPIAFNLRGREGGAQLEVDPTGMANIRAASGGSSRTMVAQPIAFDCKSSGQNGFGIGEIASTLRSMGHSNSHQNGGGHQAVAFAQNQRDEVRTMDVVGALAAEPGAKQQTYIHQQMHVRRLTPRECERLQGFPDDFTLVPYGRPSKAKLDADFIKYLLRGNPKHLTRDDIDRLAKDAPRYKALGNSMAVPVMRWIGSRIDAVSQLWAA